MADSQEIETLTALLKEKAKDLKGYKKKLKKCEEKYVEAFKENKIIKADRESLVKLLIESYNDPEIQSKLAIEEFGCYSYEDLKPVLEEAKEKEHLMYKQMSDADLIPDMQRQIDIYKEEFKNFTDQVNEQKRVIQETNEEIQKHKRTIEEKDKEIKAYKNDNEHMKARLNSLQKTLDQQSEYIDDIKEVHEDKTKEKAEEIMGQFQSLLGIEQDESESPNIKRKVSDLQDENLQLKEAVSSLKSQLSTFEKESGSRTNDEKEEIQKSTENKEEDLINNSKYLELMQQVTGYKAELEDKDQELEELSKKSKEAETLVENLTSELNKSKNTAKEYIIQKEKEIERLKLRLRQNSSIKGVSSSENTSGEKTNQSVEISNEHLKSDIPDTFFNESSEEEPECQKSYSKDEVLLGRRISTEEVKDLTPISDNGEPEGMNIEYIKNVYISYLEYKAMKNDKEAKTCEKVLFTALKLTPDQIKEIDNLRKKYKNYKFWKLIPQSSASKLKKEKEMQMLLANSARVQAQERRLSQNK